MKGVKNPDALMRMAAQHVLARGIDWDVFRYAARQILSDKDLEAAPRALQPAILAQKVADLIKGGGSIRSSDDNARRLRGSL